jgi:hypothetical protein
MLMMGSKQRRFASLIHVSLEELVPHAHVYRHLEWSLDLTFVRKGRCPLTTVLNECSTQQYERPYMAL